jgi:hypothetical protein
VYFFYIYTSDHLTAKGNETGLWREQYTKDTDSTDGIGVALADRSNLLTALAPVRAACVFNHTPNQSSIIDHYQAPKHI